MDLWTKKHGDNYRRIYSDLTFKQKQKIANAVLSRYIQASDVPEFLNLCLKHIQHENLKVCELGGYDGRQAACFPSLHWINYDFSTVAQHLNNKIEHQQNYRFVLLTRPFWETAIEECDIFYSSKTLEHLSLEEAKKCISHCKARWHVHIVDWYKKDDMHVIDGGHQDIVDFYKSLGYRVVGTITNGYSSCFFTEKPVTSNLL